MTKHRNDEQRKEQICRAAARCFVQRGFAATRLLDIAREAGMSKGGIYFHFRAKEDLVPELLARGATRFEARVGREVEAGVSVADVLARAVRAHLCGIDEDGCGTASLAMALLSLASYSESCRSALVQYERRHRGVYRAICERGIRAGLFRRARADELAEVAMSTAHGAAMTALLSGTRIDAAAAAKVGRRVVAFVASGDGGARRTGKIPPQDGTASTVEFAR